MDFLKIIGALIVAFFIEEPIIDALSLAVCETGGAFWCLFIRVISLTIIFSVLYGLVNLIFPRENRH